MWREVWAVLTPRPIGPRVTGVCASCYAADPFPLPLSPGSPLSRLLLGQAAPGYAPRERQQPAAHVVDPIDRIAPGLHHLPARVKNQAHNPQAALDTPRRPAYAQGMELNLTPGQQALVRQAIASGRLHDEQQAVQEALALWEDRELARATLIASLDEAEASIDRGEGIEMTPASLRELAEDVKQRGRARLAAKQPAPR